MVGPIAACIIQFSIEVLTDLCQTQIWTKFERNVNVRIRDFKAFRDLITRNDNCL